METLTSYDIALMQYKEETGNSKKDFDKQIKEHGYDYVKYYENRYHEVQAGCDCYDPECF